MSESDFTIGFIGLGLIGGSIAKAIRELHPKYRIIASARSRETVAYALEHGIIDYCCEGVDENFAQCDYIFLCAPVSYNTAYLKTLKDIIKPDCLLTDVGSVKTGIHKEVEQLGLTRQFIGGHPMAGSEKTGIQNAAAMLLENAYYVLTPTSDVPQEKVDEYRELVASMKAIPLILDYQKHDYITAAISHLPHIIASQLVNLIQKSDDDEEHMKLIAAGGFKDITRIASASPTMWQQICLTNTENIEKILDDYLEILTSAKQALHSSDEDALYDLFETARNYRDSIPNASLGPIKKQYAVYCDIRDEAGGIATIATLLASNGINIKNIGIVHNREFEEGVLRIEFYQEEDSIHCAELLEKYNYAVYRR